MLLQMIQACGIRRSSRSAPHAAPRDQGIGEGGCALRDQASFAHSSVCLEVLMDSAQAPPRVLGQRALAAASFVCVRVLLRPAVGTSSVQRAPGRAI